MAETLCAYLIPLQTISRCPRLCRFPLAFCFSSPWSCARVGWCSQASCVDLPAQAGCVGTWQLPLQTPWARGCVTARGDSRVTESKAEPGVPVSAAAEELMCLVGVFVHPKGCRRLEGSQFYPLWGEVKHLPAKGSFWCLLTPGAPAQGRGAVPSHRATLPVKGALCRENLSITVRILLEIIPGKSGTSQIELIN